METRKTFVLAVILLIQQHAIEAASPPTFSWARRIASTIETDMELAIGLAADNAGNTYVTGWFDGVNDFGGSSLTSYGGQDIFVSKHNASGATLWVRQAGGANNGWEHGRGVGLDAAGNVYVTGGFLGTSAQFGNTNMGISGSDRGDTFFLAKYDANGAVQWVLPPSGTTGSTYGTGIAVDAEGNACVVGYVEGPWMSLENTRLDNLGDYSAFLAKYNSGGALRWARILSCNQEAYSTTVGMDAAGNCYVGGTFMGTLQFGTTNLTSANSRMGFLAKYDGDGRVQWARPIKGAGSEGCRIGVDASGNCYAVGSFDGTVDFGGMSLVNTKTSAMFLAKYNTAGEPQWARKAEGTGLYTGFNEGGCVIDREGNCYVPAMFGGTLDFGGQTIAGQAGGDFGADLYVAKYDLAGNFQWALSAGGDRDDLAMRLALDPAGNCYVVGWFQGTASFGTNTIRALGYRDLFLAKIEAPAASTSNLKLNVVLANGSPQLEVAGAMGKTIAVEYASTLAPGHDWTSLTNFVLSRSPFIILDATLPGTSQRYYRAKELP